MSYIFFSHASEDKVDRVRPLVEVMVAEGETVWIDRPGMGPGNFGFTQSYIAENDIDFLQSGKSWSASIQLALRNSGAVLGCLSKALLQRRDVLEGELTVADAMGKLVTCIVDDLAYSDLPKFSHGLLDLGKHQTPAINTGLLAEALRANKTRPVDQLPMPLRVEWEKVRNLIASVNRVRTEPRSMRESDKQRIVPFLRSVPIPPVFKITELPDDILFAFSDHLNTQTRAQALLVQANALVTAATDDAAIRPKMAIRNGEVPAIGSTSGQHYWSQVFRVAGLIARRTVAALVAVPVAEWALEQAGCAALGRTFLEKLRVG